MTATRRSTTCCCTGGWRSFGTGDFAVRSLSGLFSLAALPLAWIIGRRRGGREAGLDHGRRAGHGAVRAALRHRDPHVLDGHLPRARRLPAGRRRHPPGPRRRAAPGRPRARHRSAAADALLVVLADRRRRAGAGLAVVAGPHARDPPVRRPGPSSPSPPVASSSSRGCRRSCTSRRTRARPWASAQQPFSIMAIVLADFGGGGFRAADFVGAVLLVLDPAGGVRRRPRPAPHRPRPPHACASSGSRSS